MKSVDAHARSVIEFAIRWAPFGGAPSDELMITFGVDRWRFLQMIREALRPHASDRPYAQTIKHNLLEVVSWSWHAYPDSSVSHPKCQWGTIEIDGCWVASNSVV
ncbi:hypothetical protein [Nocardia sp. NPDC004711]